MKGRIQCSRIYVLLFWMAVMVYAGLRSPPAAFRSEREVATFFWGTCEGDVYKLRQASDRVSMNRHLAYHDFKIIQKLHMHPTQTRAIFNQQTCQQI